MRLTPTKKEWVYFMSTYESEKQLRHDSGEGTLPSPIEAWRKAPAQIITYPSERVSQPDGTTYTANPGRRLLIGGIPVMDTCEGPWADETVALAFSVNKIRFLDLSYKLKVLERGAGLNIVGTRIINRLVGRGSGEYHVIELNDDVADNAEKWKEHMDETIAGFKIITGIKYDIKIFVHRGEARGVTRKLVLDEERKFNIILSDTYPLTEEESGINDIEDLDVISKGLYKEGVFAFFPYDASSEGVTEDGYVTARQSAMLRPYFPRRITSVADIKPPAGYTYLFHEDGTAARKLPVIVCTKNGS